jgi:hypothetical protein
VNHAFAEELHNAQTLKENVAENARKQNAAIGWISARSTPINAAVKNANAPHIESRTNSHLAHLLRERTPFAAVHRSNAITTDTTPGTRI